jgi:hypothetical protein
MSLRRGSNAADLDDLLLNARLRDELEPYYDESLDLLNWRRLPTDQENEFLASMLAWERAPVLPIASWFEPELRIPSPEALRDEEVHEVLWRIIDRLAEKRIFIEQADHLSDRQLYCVIYRDILPAPEKRLDPPRPLRFSCVDARTDPETWLRFYASDDEREQWAEEMDDVAPPPELPRFPRDMPR